MYRDIKVIIGGAGTLLLFAVLLFIKTPNGTLRVEILDNDVTLQLKGTSILLEASDTEPVSLEAGEKKLIVKRGDLVFETEAFAMRKGTETRVKVELVDEKLVVNSDGRLIGEKMLKPAKPPIESRASGMSTPQARATTDTGSSEIPPPSQEGVPSLAIAPFNSDQARAYQDAWAEYLKLPVTFENKLGMAFTLIPPESLRWASPNRKPTRFLYKMQNQYA